MEETPEKSSAEQLGNEALAFIEHLRERYGEDFEIGETMLIAEVIVDQEGEELSCVEYAASDGRRYVQVGFLTAALRAAERMLDSEDIAPPMDPDED